jgi:catechol 2,3-dioxygenase-like lactoylglutathione lyase family enzyme
MAHRKARLLPGEAAVDGATHAHQRTVRLRIFSVPIGTSALLQHLHDVGRTRNPHRTAEAYPGAAMLILLVRDIDSIFSRLKAAGVTVLTKGGAPMSVGPSKTARGVIVQDPDGHPIELAQIEPTPPTTAAAESNVIGIRLRITVRDSDEAASYYRHAVVQDPNNLFLVVQQRLAR